MYGLNQGVLLEVLRATDGATAEVCNVQGTKCFDYVGDLAAAITTYVLIDIPNARDRFNPKRAEDFADENVRQATVIIAQYLSHMCQKRGRKSRLDRIMSLVNQQQVA